MRYYTLGIIFLFISLITILISFYCINLTRSFENEIENVQLKISFLKDKIKINELEYVAHLQPDYLKKLEQIYFLKKYNKQTDLNIIGVQEFRFKDLGQVIKVTSN